VPVEVIVQLQVPVTPGETVTGTMTLRLKPEYIVAGAKGDIPPQLNLYAITKLSRISGQGRRGSINGSVGEEIAIGNTLISNLHSLCIPC
jgi:hypothetical protein